MKIKPGTNFSTLCPKIKIPPPKVRSRTPNCANWFLNNDGTKITNRSSSPPMNVDSTSSFFIKFGVGM